MNMKATLWLWSLVTVLVCVSQRVSAGPYTDTRIIQPQDNSLVAPAKRTKPSLSIVNPLDVLRQRIILEMARRQMRENTRQVERNKAILREIGKRSHAEFRSSDGDDTELGSPAGLLLDRLYYPPPPRPVAELAPYLRRFAGSAGSGAVDYDLDSREQRKSTGGSSGSSSNNKATDDSSNNPNGKPINEQISSGPLTLAKEQRRLEQQEEAEKAAGAFHPQQLRFSNDRPMVPPNDGFLDDPRDDGDVDDDDEDEYLAGNEDLVKGRERLQQLQQQQQRDQKLKSDNGYRLRYLNNIQAKMYG
uniref:Diuretic hormone n=1 Tax=Culex pipiens TaxID=7175 RepID=A0A8D8HII6_CULPI